MLPAEPCTRLPWNISRAPGLPVWLALHHVPDWRWLRDRPDSPWYPSARLFRQPAPGAWPAVFQQLAEALRERSLCTPVPRRWQVDVSAGELLDKLSILRIKAQRIADANKLRNVQAELTTLQAVRDTVTGSAELQEWEKQLTRVNEQLWDIEEAIRNCEREKDFGPRFIELARSVYRINDRRASLKRTINALLDSALAEEKSYPQYDPPE